VVQFGSEIIGLRQLGSECEFLGRNILECLSNIENKMSKNSFFCSDCRKIGILGVIEDGEFKNDIHEGRTDFLIKNHLHH
jgi:hypothetical protein